MFKRNIFKILAIVFFLLAGITFYNSSKTIPKKVGENKQVVKKIISPTIILSPVISRATTSTTVPTQIITQSTDTPAPQSFDSAQNKPTSTPAESTPQNFKISLTINGSLVGLIDMSQGANQCDVLSQALSQGKIQSLNMRYNNDLGTNAVYQINGIGKENSVWWTFKVNGQSPSQGCSYIKVESDDNAEWSYIGN